MLTIYYYPQVNLDEWYMFQIHDSEDPLGVMSTDTLGSVAPADNYDYAPSMFQLLRWAVVAYGIPRGVFNPAVQCFTTPSLEAFQLIHPEFFI